jgi:hypothetical protein
LREDKIIIELLAWGLWVCMHQRQLDRRQTEIRHLGFALGPHVSKFQRI